MSNTLSKPVQLEVDSSVLGGEVDDGDIFFTRHTLFFLDLGGVCDGSMFFGAGVSCFNSFLFGFLCSPLMNFFKMMTRLSSLGGVTSTSPIL
jgi:hypothetical protein